ncbi:MAG: DUF2635 domain-containing protein [Alphaproteobacteria bacterium]|nr:DUF2635 domain-containing protein [Alphaproteobacteria bacterium]
MRVKPNPNRKVDDKALQVFDPVHCDYLPEEGREVPNNAYWMRRLQVQDVVEATADAKAEKTEPAKANQKKTGGSKNTAKSKKAKAEKTEPEAPAEGDKVTKEENKE